MKFKNTYKPLGVLIILIIHALSINAQQPISFDSVRHSYESPFAKEYPFEVVLILDSILSRNNLDAKVEAAVLYNKGMILYGNKQDTEAIECFKALLNKKEVAYYASNVLLMQIGFSYENLYLNEKAEKYYSQAIESTLNENKQVKAKLFILLGRVYYKMGVYEKAFNNYHESYNICNEIADTNTLINVLSNLGIVHDEWGQHNKAIEAYLKGLQLAIEVHSVDYISKLNNNLGVSYFCLEKYHKALEYYNKALAIELEKENEIDIAGSYHNIGNVYEVLGDYNTALFYYLKAIDIQNAIDDYDGLVLALNDIALVYGYMGDIEIALDYCNKSRDIAIGKNMIKNEMFAYETLVKLYTQQKSYDLAFQNQNKLIAIKDSLFTIEKNQEIAEQQARFNNEQNEIEIALLSKEKEVSEVKIERQRTVTSSFVILIILLLVALFIGYRLFYNKKIAHEKLQRQEEKIIEMSKKVMEQNDIFTDNLEYGRVIQKAVLTGDKIINKWFSDSFYINLPQLIVSGDFYWAKSIGSMVYVVVSDCTGHGVPGGFMSMLGVAFLNDIITDKFKYYPNELLDILRNRIKEALNQTDMNTRNHNGMDLACCMFDFDNMKLYFSGAHMPIWHNQNNEIKRIKGDLMPIGVSVKEKPFSMQEISFKKGDRFYMFTDGMIDQFNPTGQKISSKRLEEELVKVGDLSAKQQKKQLLDNFLKWKNEMPQTDDTLLLGLFV